MEFKVVNESFSPVSGSFCCGNDKRAIFIQLIDEVKEVNRLIFSTGNSWIICTAHHTTPGT
jgi:hypothetical protein